MHQLTGTRILAPVLEILTSLGMNISIAPSQTPTHSSVLKTWSLSPTSLQPVSGHGAGMVLKFMVRLTLNPVNIYLSMESHALLTALVCHGSSVRCSSIFVSCGSLMELEAKTISWPIVCLGGQWSSGGVPFTALSPVRADCRQSAWIFSLIISTLCPFNLPGRTTIRTRSKKPAEFISLQKLEDKLATLTSMAWASSTIKALNSRQKAFLEFCNLYDKKPIPASSQTLALFAVYLVASGRIQSAASIKQYLSSVRTMHRANNSDCATPKSSPDLEFALSGITRHDPQSACHLLLLPF